MGAAKALSNPACRSGARRGSRRGFRRTLSALLCSEDGRQKQNDKNCRENDEPTPTDSHFENLLSMMTATLLRGIGYHGIPLLEQA